MEMTRTRRSTTRSNATREDLSRNAPRLVAGPSPSVATTDGTEGIAELAEAIRTLRTVDEVTAFLRDLCTRAELEALAHRWETARLVDQGVPYVEIAERVPTSTATVTRVAQWVRHGAGGYRIALDRGKRR